MTRSDGEFHFAGANDPSLNALPEHVARVYAVRDSGMAQEYALHGNSLQAMHLDLSRAAIFATANAGLNRTPAWRSRMALVLGAGNCSDIPVSDLVDMFDRTVLVDIHTKGTERALFRTLPRVNLQK